MGLRGKIEWSFETHDEVEEKWNRVRKRNKRSGKDDIDNANSQDQDEWCQGSVEDEKELNYVSKESLDGGDTWGLKRKSRHGWVRKSTQERREERERAMMKFCTEAEKVSLQVARENIWRKKRKGKAALEGGQNKQGAGGRGFSP
ncbi:hypothetical protein B7463_g8546, partial [Scytalidium lignicola]